MFTTAPEEIRIVAPIDASYLISITDDLRDGDLWAIPADFCRRIDD